MKVAGLGQSSLDYIASVDAYPAEDEKCEAASMTVQGGGPVATALVSLSRLGVRTWFAGVVSDDDAGLQIRKGLKSEGVNTAALKVRKGGSSQRAFIIASAGSGSRTIVWQRPACAELRPGEVAEAFIKGKDFLLLDGLMEKASLKAAELAKKLGVPVMLDAGRLRPGMLELAALSDYVVCAERFARDIGGPPRTALRKLRDMGVKAATVTLGAEGSVTWHEHGFFSTPAFRVKAVDTTGAGDVFHGGYIYGLLKGWEIERTVEFASAFAALKCLRPGGRTGIPTLRQTQKFLKERGRG